MPNLKIVDLETGEILGDVNSDGKNLNDNSCKFLHDTITWGKGLSFIKVFRDNYMKAANSLTTTTAVAVASILSNYIAYRSNLLCRREERYPLNNTDIQEITGLSNKTVIKIMDELVQKKVFARANVGHSYQYYANPYIYVCGTRINKTLQAMFENYPHRFEEEQV